MLHAPAGPACASPTLFRLACHAVSRRDLHPPQEQLQCGETVETTRFHLRAHTSTGRQQKHRCCPHLWGRANVGTYWHHPRPTTTTTTRPASPRTSFQTSALYSRASWWQPASPLGGQPVATPLLPSPKHTPCVLKQPVVRARIPSQWEGHRWVWAGTGAPLWGLHAH